MHRTWFVIASAGSILLLLAATGAADPITATYSIHIDERCDPNTCLPFSRPDFPLTLTFDSAFSESISDTEQDRFYGVPEFSSVPLGLPEVLPGVSPQGFPTAQINVLRDTGLWDHFGNALLVSLVTIDNIEFRWTTELFRVHGGFATPELGAHELTRLLGEGPNTSDAAGFAAFSFSARDASDTFLPGTLVYEGSATFQDSVATPEPATLGLVAVGLIGSLLNARRRGFRLGRGDYSP